MHDGAGRADQGLERALDQLLAALDEHLYLDVVGYEAFVDDEPLEVVVRLGGRREPDLDLLEPDVDQRLEQRQLALGVHGVDERLVAVAQVDAGPAWRPGELAVRPRAVAQHERHVRAIPVERHGRRVTGQRQVTPPHVATTPFLSLSHVFRPFSCGVSRPRVGPTKNPLAVWRRRLRANAMWRSPSGKQQVGRRGLHDEAILPSGGHAVKEPAPPAPVAGTRNGSGCRPRRCGPPPRPRSRDRTGRRSRRRPQPPIRRAVRRRRRPRCRPPPPLPQPRRRSGSGCGCRPASAVPYPPEWTRTAKPSAS